MANPKIKVKRSSIEGKVPAVTQLERGELAVNSYDGKVYILKDQFSVGIATTTHTINPWNEPNGVGAGISYGGDIKVLGISTFSNDIRVVDDKKIQLGNSQDLEIYHDSSDAVSVIKDAGTGQLKIMGSTVSIRSANDAKAMAVFIPNGASSVFYSGSKKFETTSSGINVIGVTTTTGLAVTGDSTFSNKLDVDGHTRLNSFLNVSGISTFQNDITIKENSPNLKFHDINADADNQRWDLKCGSNNTFMIQAINDAGGGGGNLFEFTRNGNAIQTFVGKRSGITWFTVDNLNKKVTTEKLTIGDYDMPSTIGAQDTVLKSDGTNVVFGSAASATFTEKAFTATQGQTVFTDTTTLPTYVQVFVNGIKIRPTSDFSKSGASITLVTAATAGDEIDIVRFD